MQKGDGGESNTFFISLSLSLHCRTFDASTPLPSDVDVSLCCVLTESPAPFNAAQGLLDQRNNFDTLLTFSFLSRRS